jgi:flagellar basal-body rod modification protein FlgD
MIDHVSVFHPLRPLDSSANSTTGTSDSSNSDTTAFPNDTLDANSFITLLTTELQAQDPTNPLDPTTLVSQLTDLNSLQELIQIRSDLDTLVSDTTAPPSGTTNAGTAGIAGPVAPAANTLGATPSSATSNAASALKAQTVASVQSSLSSLKGLLNNSISGGHGSAASQYSKLRSLSHSF